MNEKRRLIELAGLIQRDLDEAPNWRVNTEWWDDRILALMRLQQQIAQAK